MFTSKKACVKYYLNKMKNKLLGISSCGDKYEKEKKKTFFFKN